MTLAPLGSFALKGRAETVAAYRVVSLERPAGAPATAFVGRDDELRRLMAVYDARRRGAAGAPRRAPRLARARQVAPDRRVRAPPRRRGRRSSPRTATPPAAPPSRRSPRRCARSSASTTAAAATPCARRSTRRCRGDDAERARIAAGVARAARRLAGVARGDVLRRAPLPRRARRTRGRSCW